MFAKHIYDQHMFSSKDHMINKHGYCQYVYMFSFVFKETHRLYTVHQSFPMFRCGTAPLRIETGRYVNIALNDRICQLYDCENVEDERPFLMSCIALNYERRNLYIIVSQSITDFNLLSDEGKFLTLMSIPLICKFTARAC